MNCFPCQAAGELHVCGPVTNLQLFVKEISRGIRAPASPHPPCCCCCCEKGFDSGLQQSLFSFSSALLTWKWTTTITMPLMFLERFPWPSLQTYTALSVALLAGSIFSAYTTVTDPGFGVLEAEETPASPEVDLEHLHHDLSQTDVANTVLWYLITDSLFVWVSVIFFFLKSCICLGKTMGRLHTTVYSLFSFRSWSTQCAVPWC